MSDEIQPDEKPAILALDTATLTGFCLWDIEKGKPITAGRLDNSIRIKATKTIPADPRNLRLWKFYRNLDHTAAITSNLGYKIVVVSHESIVQGRAAGGKTAEVARHLEAICHLWCKNVLDLMPLQYAAGTIKKFATGNGNALKPQVMEAAELRWPRLVRQLVEAGEWDDNASDALHLAALTAFHLNK